MSVIKKIFLSLILVSAILFIVEIDKIYAADTPDSVMAGADSFITDGEKMYHIIKMNYIIHLIFV